MAYSSRQSKNATSALGRPSAQATVYGVWFSGIAIGVILILILAGLVGNNHLPTARQKEDSNSIRAKDQPYPGGLTTRGVPYNQPLALDTANGTVTEVEQWKAQGAAGQTQLKDAIARGNIYFAQICIGCHAGPLNSTSNGPWFGNLYQTKYLYNGQPVNDANVVYFILRGHGNMPAGIPLPQQAVDIMLYVKNQTSGSSNQAAVSK